MAHRPTRFQGVAPARNDSYPNGSGRRKSEATGLKKWCYPRSMWHLSDWPEGLLVLRQEHWFQPRVHAPGCPVRHWMVSQRNLSDMMSQRIHWWQSLWQIWWSKTKCPEKSRRSRASGARFQCSLGWALLPAEWLSGDIGNSAQGLTESGHFDRSSTADYRWSASSGTSQLCSNMRRSRGHRDPMTGPGSLIDSCWSMLVVIPFDCFHCLIVGTGSLGGKNSKVLCETHWENFRNCGFLGSAKGQPKW